MATPVTMPQMGYDMTEGSIQTWVKKEGDKIAKGDTLAEIETDKTTMDMEAFASGILKRILVQPGEMVPVGTVIAVIADENEAVDWKALGLPDAGGSAAAPAQTSAPKEAPQAAPVAQPVVAAKAATTQVASKAPVSVATSNGINTVSRKPVAGLINLAAPVVAASGPGGALVPAETASELEKVTDAPVKAAAPAPAQSAAPATQTAIIPAPAPASYSQNGNGNGRIKSSPLARKVAGDLGVELGAVSGTGPGGRVIRVDVENYASTAPTSAPSAVAPDAQPATTVAETSTANGAEYTEQTLSRMRQTIARRMTEAKQQVPHFYVSNEIDMTEALKLRLTLNAANEGGAKISVNDMVLKAVAKALRKYPALNNSYVDGKIRVNQRVNIALAVALEEGLITPVVTDVDQKSIGQVATEARELALKARAGSLKPEEFQGGTFTVSNLGMFDVSSFVAIINPPQAAILAIGSTKPVVVVKSGSPEEGNTEFGVIQQMTATISADHRATDGAVAAQFLQELKRILQNPMLLLI